MVIPTSTPLHNSQANSCTLSHYTRGPSSGPKYSSTMCKLRGLIHQIMTTIMVNMKVVSSMAFDASNNALLQCGSYMRSVEYYYYSYNTSMDCVLRCHITLSDTAQTQTQTQTQTLLAGRCNNRENKKRRQRSPARQHGCVISSWHLDSWDVRSTVTATAFEACLEIKRK